MTGRWPPAAMADAARRPSSGLEAGVAAVRTVLLVLTAVSVVALSGARIGWATGLHLGILAATAAGIVIAWRLIGPRDDGAPRTSAVVLHVIETLWFVGLVAALGEALPDGAWMVLVVPMVIAAARLTDVAVLGTWCAEAVAYVAISWVWPERTAALSEALFERLALLLAVAASIALLMRWMREEWKDQVAATREAEHRLSRLSVIETAAREMRRSTRGAVIEQCLSAVVRLGFEAATLHPADGAPTVAGDGDLVPLDGRPEPSSTGVIDVTEWLDANGDAVHSVAVIETYSGGIVTGWIREPVNESLARALGELVTNASSALEAVAHLERARFEASHDPLTELANRGELERVLGKVATRREPVAVVFIDLDHFKPVNDTYGHAAGDALLITLARRLDAVVARDGLAARYGGDEFVIVLWQTPLEGALAVAERARHEVGEPVDIDGVRVKVSGSVGVSAATGPVDPTALVKEADEAAYAAKNAGRDRVEIGGATAERHGIETPGGNPQPAPQHRRRTDVDDRGHQGLTADDADDHHPVARPGDGTYR